MGTNYSIKDAAEHQPHSQFLSFNTSASLVSPLWVTNSVYGLTGAMLAAVAAALTYECLREYLLHPQRLSRLHSECFGAPTISCGEKLGQTIIYTMRVSFAYFLMLCVMTMNIWLLVAVFVGSTVGYLVGKPLMANGIHDAISSHGYESVSLQISSGGRKNSKRTERSLSWRYQPINVRKINSSKRGSDSVFEEELNSGKRIQTSSKIYKRDIKPSQEMAGVANDNDPNNVWLRKDSENLDSLDSNSGTADLQSSASIDNQFDSIRSSSRFRSTSKIINSSLTSQRSTSNVSRQSSSSTIRIVQASPELQRGRTHAEDAHVQRSASSASYGRFKPTSRQIRKQVSLNEPQTYHPHVYGRETDRV
ncbi:COPT2-like protein [Mya arenaria]|uniref:Copper transport protein n=1 Tax=Mya arenaria TaxID=6604 RepID=A0ABY7FR26_MYAAR|nr:COPT2-like protein [Mya arenaria]